MFYCFLIYSILLYIYLSHAINNEILNPITQNHLSEPLMNANNNNLYSILYHSFAIIQVINANILFTIFVIMCPQNNIAQFFIIFSYAIIDILMSSSTFSLFGHTNMIFLPLLIGHYLMLWRLLIILCKIRLLAPHSINLTIF